jgi:hypothetical protein
LQQRRDRPDSRIVDEHRYAGILLQSRLDACEVFELAQVSHKNFDRAARVIADARGKRVEAFSLVVDDGQVVAPSRQAFCVSGSDPARRSGNHGHTLCVERHSTISRLERCSRKFLHLLDSLRNVVDATFTDTRQPRRDIRASCPKKSLLRHRSLVAAKAKYRMHARAQELSSQPMKGAKHV